VLFVRLLVVITLITDSAWSHAVHRGVLVGWEL